MVVAADRGSAELDAGIAIRTYGANPGVVDIAGEEFMKGVTEGVMSDLPIWRNKVHRAKPVFCAADKYLAEFRKWAKQFYTEPA